MLPGEPTELKAVLRKGLKGTGACHRWEHRMLPSELGFLVEGASRVCEQNRTLPIVPL